jgi:hypothetical protein
MKKRVVLSAILAGAVGIAIFVGLVSCNGTESPTDDPTEGISGTDGINGTSSTGSSGNDVTGSNPNSSAPTTDSSSSDATADDTPAIFSDWRLSTPADQIAFEQTRTYESLKILDGDTFMLEFNVGMTFKKYVRGRDIRANISVVPFLIVGGNRYRVNHGDMAWYYRPAVQSDYDEIYGHFEDFFEFIDLEGYTLAEVGTARFRNFLTLYYEKFENDLGETKQIFFNHFFDEEMYGIIIHEEGREHPRNYIFHVSANVPDDVFELTDGFERRPEP